MSNSRGSTFNPEESFPGSLVNYDRTPRRLFTLSTLRSLSWKQIIGTEDLKGEVYKASVIELIGTALLIFCQLTLGMATVTLEYRRPSAVMGLMQVPLVGIFILSTAPLSGGHLNPLISLFTMFIGLTSPIRAVLYVCAQCTGSIIGASISQAALGNSLTSDNTFGACLIYDFSTGRALVLEFAYCFTLLLVVYGIVFNSEQSSVFSPAFGPFFISSIVGFITFISQGLIPEASYFGAALNPARCLGPAILQNEWKGQWVWWAGSLLAILFASVTVWCIPPSSGAIESPKSTDSSVRRNNIFQPPN